MKVEIKSRWSLKTIFECEIDAKFENSSPYIQMGEAVKCAVLRGVDLRDADLRGVDLRGVDLRGVDLSGVDLRDADLRGADLRGVDLRGVDLRGVVLSGVDLRGVVLRGVVLSGVDLRDADLRGVDLRDADLRGADLRGVDLRGVVLRGNMDGVPFIKNIHQTIYKAASKPGCLDMGSWHSGNACGTTHCRAGWVVFLAGEAGRAMDFCLGTPAAAALIYIKSDPKLEKIPDFYAGNEDALADMKRLAELEKS